MILSVVKIPELLHDLRASRALSQADLAALSGIHVNTIKRMESAHGTPRSSTLVRLLRSMQKQAEFSIDEIDMIREMMRIDVRVLSPSATKTAAAQSCGSLVDALRSLVGTQRAEFLLKTLLIAETNRLNSSVPAVKITKDPERGPDGKLYQMTEFHPTGAVKPPAVKAQSRKSV